MFDKENIWLWLLGLAVAAALIMTFKRYLRSQSTEARRRARNYGPVVSRKRGPAVKLAVNVGEKKKKD